MNKVKKLFNADLTSVIIPVLILFVLLSMTSSGFLTKFNLNSIMQLISVYVIVGLAQMAVLSLGQMNLAVGSIGCLSGIMFGMCLQVFGIPIIASILIGLIVAALLGLIQGELIARTGINPFIITLALLSTFKGLVSVITKGQSYQGFPASFKMLNKISIGPVPIMFLFALVVLIIVFVVFKYFLIGKKLLACGENPKAAQYSGINVKKTIVIGHIISGLLCGIAAIIQISKFGSAQLSVGDDWMLVSFVVPVLGGTLLSGGKVSAIGTLLGGVLMVLINNALVIWGVSSYTFQTFIGVILLLAYEVDRTRINLVNKQAYAGIQKGGK